ncbi:MAG: N-acyl amino acid synthase FeeM domain-containing protein [Rhizobiaceae bacterium]
MSTVSVVEGVAAEVPPPPQVRQSGFTRGVQALLERTEYRRCDSGEDYEDICRLRYKAYRAHGFVPETPGQATSDSMDDLPNCYRYGVFIDGELVSTVRVHHISGETPWGPAMSSFGDELAPRLERGESFINPSLLAGDPDLLQISRFLPFVTLRIGIAANSWFDATHCIVLIRKEHTAFYARVFMAEQIGAAKTYPPFTVPVMLYGMDCARQQETLFQRFPFFRSTPMEQRLLFGPTAIGDPAPLTVLPTARYTGIAA